MRPARDAAHLTSLGVHLHRHRQERTGQRPQRPRRWHLEPVTHAAALRVRWVAITFAARVVPTVPATPALALTWLRGGRLPGLRMVGVGRRRPTDPALDVGSVGLRVVGVASTLVLRLVMERLATS